MIGIAFASIVATAPNAAAEVGVNSCVRTYLTTGYHGPYSVVNKAASTCNDLNLVYADDSTSPYGDRYAGFYRTSDGVWHIGTRGYLWASDGNVNWLVLLSDVRTGTPMGVGSWYDGGDLVQVAH
jgi:hypothetical protein